MSRGAYGLAARSYYDAGWSPVPLPPGEKHPPADGFTGVSGKYVDELQLRRWLGKEAAVSAGRMQWKAGDGQIALRLPRTVLGIDADMYEGKEGRKTMEKAVRSWGPLPDTWRTSSRSDGSGILLFSIPEGLAWPGKLPQGGGVELIRWDHRYAIVGPSRHDKTGKVYGWSFGEDLGHLEEFPDNDGSLPALPELWVTGLTSGKKWAEREAADMQPEDVRLWLSDRHGPELCAAMRSTMTKYSRQLRAAGDDGGTHDAARDGAWALIGDAHAGHSGVEKALSELRKVFVTHVARRSSEREAKGEWGRIVVRGVQKVAAEGEANSEDICELLRDRKRPGESSGGGEDSNAAGGNGSAHLNFARTDSGNAERLVLAHRHEQRFVSGLGWFVWNAEEERWTPDADGLVNRRAIAVARAISGEADYLAEDNPKEADELRKFARASENVGKLKAMTELAASLSGMTLPQDAFDADPARLGRIVLKPNPGVAVTPALPEHRVTMRLGAAYLPSSSSKTWNAFLSRVQPDSEIRAWLQKLVGYSLYGGNRSRLFIACYGKSSTGKTTFLKALYAALGDYAGMVNMTVYRDNQDDKPRPDLLRVLRKRIIMSEETSAAWHLHADQVKRITGGAPMSARGMRSNEFVELVPAFTPWIFVNSPPTIEGADTAVLRRLVVVPWDVIIAEGAEDISLADRLAGERIRPAVLRWALDGWTEYAADPDLSMPLGAVFARQEFLSELSDFDRALAEIAVIDPGSYALPSALYNAYSMWCTNTRAKPESSTKFGTFLSGRGFSRAPKRLDGKVVYVRHGLRLSEEFERVSGGS